MGYILKPSKRTPWRLKHRIGIWFQQRLLTMGLVSITLGHEPFWKIALISNRWNTLPEYDRIIVRFLSYQDGIAPAKGDLVNQGIYSCVLSYLFKIIWDDPPSPKTIYPEGMDTVKILETQQKHMLLLLEFIQKLLSPSPGLQNRDGNNDTSNIVCLNNSKHQIVWVCNILICLQMRAGMRIPASHFAKLALRASSNNGTWRENGISPRLSSTIQ